VTTTLPLPLPPPLPFPHVPSITSPVHIPPNAAPVFVTLPQESASLSPPRLSPVSVLASPVPVTLPIVVPDIIVIPPIPKFACLYPSPPPPPHALPITFPAPLPPNVVPAIAILKILTSACPLVPPAYRTPDPALLPPNVVPAIAILKILTSACLLPPPPPILATPNLTVFVATHQELVPALLLVAVLAPAPTIPAVKVHVLLFTVKPPLLPLPAFSATLPAMPPAPEPTGCLPPSAVFPTTPLVLPLPSWVGV